jgi:hypothetical protein
MYALSYTWRVCPNAMLGPYVCFKVEIIRNWRRLSDDQGCVSSSNPNIVMRELRQCQVCFEVQEWVSIYSCLSSRHHNNEERK